MNAGDGAMQDHLPKTTK